MDYISLWENRFDHEMTRELEEPSDSPYNTNEDNRNFVAEHSSREHFDSHTDCLIPSSPIRETLFQFNYKEQEASVYDTGIEEQNNKENEERPKRILHTRSTLDPAVYVVGTVIRKIRKYR
ncbi:hypothetical protein J5N97_022051 [Dioscorea zingiberensis]|uniref:Uncharacterized protein n=1 Tax=Dioscorea zingiberensis TaxID=325984 RepID=A0A9D5CA88_9LILI|nr:hypothetical protein J5N97_022051 [Dioscorea zingiberensis]